MQITSKAFILCSGWLMVVCPYFNSFFISGLGSSFLPSFVCAACIWHKFFETLLLFSAVCVWISSMNYLCNVHELCFTSLWSKPAAVAFLMVACNLCHLLICCNTSICQTSIHIASYLTTIIESKLFFHGPNFIKPVPSFDRRKINIEKAFNLKPCLLPLHDYIFKKWTKFYLTKMGTKFLSSFFFG